MAFRARSQSALLSAVLGLALASGLLGRAQSPDKPVASPEQQLQRGQSFYLGGRYVESLAAFSQAATSDVELVRTPAQVGMVRSALRLADFNLARTVATGLRGAYPSDAGMLALYGDAMWSAGLFDDAAQAYSYAASLDGNQAAARNGMARVFSAKVRYAEALDHAQAAVRLAPRESDYYYTLGIAYERLGKTGDAADALERFIALLPKGDKDDRALYAKATITALRAFGRAVPNRVAGDPTAVYEIPFRLSNDKIIVDGRLNRYDEVEFVVDTGAELATLSRRASDRYGIKGITTTVSAGVGEIGLRGLQIGRIDTLEIGKLRVSNVPCIIKSPGLVGLPTDQRESFSPLALGLSMAIDYRKQTITLARRLPTVPSASDETMALWLNRLATVRGVVGTQHARSFVVDTGGQVISISLDTAKVLPLTAGVSHVPLRVYGASGWDRDAYLLPGVDLAFNDNIHFEQLSVVVLNLRAPSILLGYDLGGIVGHQFLSKYHVTFDLSRAELRLKKAS